MSPRTKKIALFASLLVAGLLTFGALAALPAAMHRHGGVCGDFGFEHRAARALSALELTDEQKCRVKQVLKESGPAIEPLVDEVLRSKKALFETVHRAQFDEQAVRDAAAGEAGAFDVNCREFRDELHHGASAPGPEDATPTPESP